MNSFEILCATGILLNTTYIFYRIYLDRQNAKPNIVDIPKAIPAIIEICNKIVDGIKISSIEYNKDLYKNGYNA
jgi:hypothetical protein